MTRRILLVLLAFTAAVLVGALVPLTLDASNHDRTSFIQATAGMANTDAGLVQRTAHTVKGSLGTFAAGGAHAAAWELEKRAASGELTVGPAALERLEREVGAFLPPLTAFARGGPP